MRKLEAAGGKSLDELGLAGSPAVGRFHPGEVPGAANEQDKADAADGEAGPEIVPLRVAPGGIDGRLRDAFKHE